MEGWVAEQLRVAYQYVVNGFASITSSHRLITKSKHQSASDEKPSNEITGFAGDGIVQSRRGKHKGKQMMRGDLGESLTFRLWFRSFSRPRFVPRFVYDVFGAKFQGLYIFLGRRKRQVVLAGSLALKEKPSHDFELHDALCIWSYPGTFDLFQSLIRLENGIRLEIKVV